jgi:hypothetical protein
MNSNKIHQYVSFTSLGAAIALLTMLLISFFDEHHITQQYFEIANNADTYSKELLENASTIKQILTFDNIFIVMYTANFVFLFMALRQDENMNLWIGLAALLGTSLLDFYENHHILTFITMAEKGIVLNQDSVVSQMTLSQLKFHLSYLSFFLFAFSLPKQTIIEKSLRYSILFLQLPVGVLVYTAPIHLQPTFALMRYVFMLVGLLMISFVFYKRSDYKSSIID